ncbi:MAG: FGGY-family carbohydrate kinase [Spirochaetia bacterium]|jgi:xylulokinase|nr:FGGY-family carbohydrate kinase [Spirochaetia bacterium]
MYVGIDIGTGSLKAVLGLKSGPYTLTQKYEEGMFSGGHHRSELFRQSVLKFIKKISHYSLETNDEIEGIGFSGHGPSLVLVSSHGETLTDIITWQDSSASEAANTLKSLVKGFEKDGTCFEAKLYKLFKERKELFSGSIKALYPKDYVIFLLTGRMIIDYPTASTLAFFNPVNRLFDTFSTGIPLDTFPEIIESWESAGMTTGDFAEKCGINNNIPIICGGPDAWCEALGAGAIEEGMLVDGSGTSTCITCCRNGKDSKLSHVIPGKSLDIETMSSTGTSIDWMKNILNIDMDEIGKIDSCIPLPLVYLPYLDGERSPVWDEEASGAFLGLSSETQRLDLIKAVLQGVSFGTRQCIELAEKAGAYKNRSIRAVGGGSNNRALLQYKANITGLKYISMAETEGAALGALILASFACKEGSVNELTERWVEINFEVYPDNTYSDIWEQLYFVYSESYSNLKDSTHKLFNIKRKLKKLC